jgi:NitT/TauT family transport system ATP-binding protein
MELQKEILKFDDVSLTYQTKEGETEALRHISFSVLEGEFVAIVGPSGCGKTTILSAVTGLLKPTSGKVLIDNKPAEPDGNTGYMLQRDQLFEWRNIEKNVLLGLEIQKKLGKSEQEYALSLINKYGLDEFRFHYPSQLSGGMRQRAALIRTLAFKPKLLLLDEPFSALDFQTRLNLCNDVHAIIKGEGSTAILVTHDISEAVSLADRIIVLSKRPAEIKNIYEVDIPTAKPNDRRTDIRFQKYFNDIWKEISV